MNIVTALHKSPNSGSTIPGLEKILERDIVLGDILGEMPGFADTLGLLRSPANLALFGADSETIYRLALPGITLEEEIFLKFLSDCHNNDGR